MNNFDDNSDHNETKLFKRISMTFFLVEWNQQELEITRIIK